MPASAKLVARAMVGSPIARPFGGCLFVAGMLALLGFAFLGHLALWILEPVTRVGIFLTGVLIGTVASLPLLALLRWLDRRERESLWLAIGAVVWGAVISTGLSAIFNALGFGFISVSLEIVGGVDSELIGQLLAATLVAPPVEEAFKGLAILVLFWFLRAEFDNVRDGIIYGALVGIGFNIAEYALYVMQGYAESGVAPFAEQFAGRFVFLGFNGHMLWSAICGAGVGFARQSTGGGCTTLGAPVAGYLAATFGHALNNSVGVFLLGVILVVMGYDVEGGLMSVSPFALWTAAAIMNVLVQGVFYVALLVLLALTSRWEREVIRTYLADEVGVSVTPEEYSAIVNDRMFGALGSRGTPWQLALAQNELAFRKWHVAREGGNPATDPLVAAWRQDIATLREEWLRSRQVSQA
ncbi:PrsW family intramembrane metalloprotease [Roseiflexus castenholzii]|uniref:Membrane protein-like protein n=1 Tax=Roseiflexus castenholzii (strain DSM 13941 / HLO8) TaxID=383372 RepID=A7NK91_ROSCS|nr:PrsW family intramembrane metalloprotease [Roseiflexus castenholzii]ABU57911.1 membrane protein-like protein [Roseiflexus castenholzii DSM 13941]